MYSINKQRNMKAGHHQDVQTHLKVGPKNVEKLVRHIFKTTHPHLVEKYYPTQKNMKVEIPPPVPINLLFHPPF